MQTRGEGRIDKWNGFFPKNRAFVGKFGVGEEIQGYFQNQPLKTLP